jgi:S1-C subfamily serine protease
MFSGIWTALPLIILMILATGCKNTTTDNREQNEDNIPGSEKTETTTQDFSGEIMTYTVSLGVMPDLNHEGSGVLIGHVNQGKPGQLAGILKGDVIVRMGDDEITDLVSYTRTLGKYKKGEQTKVVVRRDDELLTMLVEF